MSFSKYLPPIGLFLLVLFVFYVYSSSKASGSSAGSGGGYGFLDGFTNLNQIFSAKDDTLANAVSTDATTTMPDHLTTYDSQDLSSSSGGGGGGGEAQTLLPGSESSKWNSFGPVANSAEGLLNIDTLPAASLIGVPSETRKFYSYDIRSTPRVDKNDNVSPWNISSLDPAQNNPQLGIEISNGN